MVAASFWASFDRFSAIDVDRELPYRVMRLYWEASSL
jgi:hypothetical protein